MTTKTERLNLRTSAAALSTLQQAAELQGQDLTSFILGAALERARGVLTEDRILRLEPEEVLQLEGALDAPTVASPQLKRLFESVRSAQQTRA